MNHPMPVPCSKQILEWSESVKSSTESYLEPAGAATATAIETRTAATAAGEEAEVAAAGAVEIAVALPCQLRARHRLHRRRPPERF